MGARLDRAIGAFCRSGPVWIALCLLVVPAAVQADGMLCGHDCVTGAGPLLLILVNAAGIIALCTAFLAAHGTWFYRHHHGLLQANGQVPLPDAPWQAARPGPGLWPVYRRSLVRYSLALGAVVGIPLLLIGPLAELGIAALLAAWGFALTMQTTHWAGRLLALGAAARSD